MPKTHASHTKPKQIRKIQRSSVVVRPQIRKIQRSSVVERPQIQEDTVVHTRSTNRSTVAFIGAGFSAGQPTGGVAEGPAALLSAGLAGAVEGLGRRFTQTELVFPSADLYPFCPDAGLHQIKHSAEAAASAGCFVLTVGGDHSIAAASICGVASVHQDVCIVWVDAHADANTPATSPSGNYHGMPAAHLMGWFDKSPPGFEWLPAEGVIDERRLVYIGLRDIDAAEAKMLRDSRVTVFTMHDVDRIGIAQVVELALAAVDPLRQRAVHLSLDIDAVDPLYAPGTGTTATGGLTPREVKYVCTELGRTHRLVGMDVVEVNPDLDLPGDSRSMHGDNPSLNVGVTPTVKLAAECVLAALDDSLDSMR